MGRHKGPTRTQKQLFFDEFCDMPLAEQERALEHLAEFHRQAKRQASKRFSEPAKEAEAPARFHGDLSE